MPNLSYSVADFVPLTKILSADVNSRFQDIKSRFNWDGTTATTGLGDSNIISNSVSGNGLTRATKLKPGTANFVVINDGTGKMSEEVTLNVSRGGTGLAIVPGSQNPGDVLQVNSTSSALVIGAPTGVPASLRLYQFQQFT